MWLTLRARRRHRVKWIFTWCMKPCVGLRIGSFRLIDSPMTVGSLSWPKPSSSMDSASLKKQAKISAFKGSGFQGRKPKINKIIGFYFQFIFYLIISARKENLKQKKRINVCLYGYMFRGMPNFSHVAQPFMSPKEWLLSEHWINEGLALWICGGKAFEA